MRFKILSLIPYLLVFTALGFLDYFVYGLYSSWPKQSLGENVIGVILIIALSVLVFVIHRIIFRMFYRTIKRKCTKCGSLRVLPNSYGGTKYAQYDCVSCGNIFWPQHST
jgi:hypothetical protein